MGAKEVGKGLNKWVAMHGRLEVICADASKTNQSEQVRQWCQRRGVGIEYSPPYHHESIGFVERFNQTLLNRFRRMWADSPRDFPRLVREAVRLYNETPLDVGWGSPIDIWKGGERVWEWMLARLRWQHRQANHRTQGRRVRR